MALVDEDQADLVGERVEVVAEHPVVESRPTVQDQQRQALAPLDDVQGGV